MELGQKLKQARLEAGLSQRQLCGDEITRNMLSQIENGSARPSMDTLRYLAGRLGKPISYFLEEAAASPNQALMTAARTAYAGGDPSAALDILENYRTPDEVFDAEQGLLRALACIALAEQSTSPDHARLLLERAAEAGSGTPYYTHELERRRLLRLASIAPEQCSFLAEILPRDDRELLLRAAAALEAGDTPRCICLLDAACDKDAPDWLLLRGDAAMASSDPEQAEACYLRAEPKAPNKACPKLEQLYLKQENFKMAYLYACKQRDSSKNI